MGSYKNASLGDKGKKELKIFKAMLPKKLKALALTSLAWHSIRAQESSPDDDEDPDNRKFSAIMDMSYYMAQEKGTAWSFTQFQARVTQYGCHCFLGASRKAGGRGVPVNELDDSCRWLYRCHRCINIDFPGECDPDHGKYKYQISNNGKVDCSRNSGCKLAMCQCDAEFAQMISEDWDDNKWDSYYWGHKANKNNPNGRYDYDTTCQTNGMNNEPDSCCGDGFPNRFPYDSSEKSCCASAGKLYNEAVQACCMDGTIRSTCD